MSSAEHGHGHGHAGEGASAESVKQGFELSDWQTRPVVMMIVATLGSLALGFIVIAILLFATGGSIGDTSHTLSPTGEVQAQLPPEPRLEQNPYLDGERMIAEATERLESYGWVNKGQGSAHIPIERAKELLLERGVSPFGSAQPQGATPTP
jgi:hypothetical protein